MPRTLAQVPAGLEDRGDRAFSLWWSVLSRPHLRVRAAAFSASPRGPITSFVPHNNPLEHVAPACDGRPSPPGEGWAHGTWVPGARLGSGPGRSPRSALCGPGFTAENAPGRGCLEERA